MSQDTQQQLYQIRIELDDSTPLVWRQLFVPANIPLDIFHRVIQGAMGWQNYHLHLFTTRSGQFFTDLSVMDDAFEEWQEESLVTLQDVLNNRSRQLAYTYDFGDDWQHSIKLEKVLPLDDGQEAGIVCLAGANACPPEDSGGVYGYQNLLSILKKPDDPEYEELKEWLGGADFDPQHFDPVATNQYIQDRLDDQFEEDSLDGSELDAFYDLPFSPNQLHQLFYSTFDSPDLLRFNPDQASPKNVPLLAMFQALGDVMTDKGIKLTPKGNLPLKVVHAMVAALNPDYVFGFPAWRRSYRSEMDVLPVHLTHLLAKLAGLCRVVKGQLVLTAKGKKALQKQDWAPAYLDLLQTVFTKFNWAYIDYKEDLQMLPALSWIILHRLQSNPEAMPTRAAADLLIAAFPMLLREINPTHCYYTTAEAHLGEIMSYRWLTLLGLLGLIHHQTLDSPDASPFQQSYAIQASDLCNHLLQWH